jgi:hypothetical protein
MQFIRTRLVSNRSHVGMEWNQETRSEALQAYLHTSEKATALLVVWVFNERAPAFAINKLLSSRSRSRSRSHSRPGRLGMAARKFYLSKKHLRNNSLVFAGGNQNNSQVITTSWYELAVFSCICVCSSNGSSSHGSHCQGTIKSNTGYMSLYWAKS